MIVLAPRHLAWLLPLLATSAQAYEGTTTLAGLTERAALASRLHRQLMERFGLPLGLFEPLQWDPEQLPAAAARDLEARLRGLDPAEGYAPAVVPGLRSPPLRRQTALGWLVAGTVLETLPPVRLRNHFLDPTGRGLSRPPGLSAAAASLRALAAGLSSFRQLVTGTAFDGTGLPSTEWLQSADNELGLVAFVQAHERAVLAQKPQARETALVQLLLAAGGMLALLEQAGDPAYVRNDLDALLVDGGPYGRHVAQRFGRAGVPAPAPAVGEPPRHLVDLFYNAAGTGLVQRTARRFFSPRTLPGTGAPLVEGARTLLGEVPARGVPLTPMPPGWPTKEAGYLGTAEIPHLAAWSRLQLGGRPLLRWALDPRCHDSYAAVLLPEIARHATWALDLLFRGQLHVDWGPPQGERRLRVRALGVALRGGTLTVAGEGAQGERRPLGTSTVGEVNPGGELPLPSLGPLAGLRRLALLYRGADEHGEPLLLATQMDLSRPEAEPSERRQGALHAPHRRGDPGLPETGPRARAVPGLAQPSLPFPKRPQLRPSRPLVLPNQASLSRSDPSPARKGRRPARAQAAPPAAPDRWQGAGAGGLFGHGALRTGVAPHPDERPRCCPDQLRRRTRRSRPPYPRSGRCHPRWGPESARTGP
ncbi:MAG: hypothetical protein RMK29_12000 [Myxococcales bacterium]|nr:hypothetical protein [Myxococcota bacterium]MDW8282432.1 hypothetical protein [Myxococcales bacterium]